MNNTAAAPAEAVAEKEKKTVISTQEQAPTLTIMSQEDAYLADRMKSGPKSLEEVVTVKERHYAPGEHRLSLPSEFKKYEKKLAFRWINKKKRAVDDAINKGWAIVNRTLFPDIAKNSPYLFSTSGAVERGDAVLAIISLAVAKQIRLAPGEKSMATVKSHLNKGKVKLPKGKSGFYEPKEKDEE
jgi:hypothetical protein